MDTNSVIAYATVGLFLVGIVTLYLLFEPPRSKDARNRARLVHDKLLKCLRKLEYNVENIMFPHLGDINNTVYSWKKFNLEILDNEKHSKLLIKEETKEKLSKLKENVVEYGKAGSLVAELIPSKIREKINAHLKNTNSVLSESNNGIYIDNIAYNNLFDIFFSIDFEYAVLKAVVSGNVNLDRNWLETINPNVYREINDAILYSESLGTFLIELDKDLNSQVPIEMLKDTRKTLLSHIYELKKLLESEKENLTSFYGFLYRSGNKKLLEEIQV